MPVDQHGWQRCGVLALMLMLGTGVPAANADESAATATSLARPYAHLGWVPRAMLPAATRARVPTYCAGIYVEGPFPLPFAVDGLEAPVEAQAGRLEYWREDRIVLEQDVRLTQGNRSVTTPRAILYEGERRLELTAPVGLREPGLRLWGDAAEILLDTGEASVHNVDFVLHGSQMRGTAERLERDEQGNLQVRHAGITRCEPGNNGWELTGRDIRIAVPGTHAVVRHAAMRVYGVPVLYAPYLQVPITDERLSGWLMPDVGYSAGDGIDIGLPYYLNLAPNYDATVTPRYISRRGSGGELELRHMSPRTRSQFNGAYLYRDDQFDGELSKRDYERLGLTREFEPADRWFASARHENRFELFGAGNGHFRTLLDYSSVSDGEYFRDLGVGFGIGTVHHLERRGDLTYRQDGLSARLWTQNFKLLDAALLAPYARLPALDVNYDQGLVGPFATTWSASLARFDRSNADLGGIDRIVGERYHVEPRLRLPLEYLFGFLRVESGYRFTQYRLDDVPAGAETTPTRGIGYGSVDAGLFFERNLSAFGADFQQTLEPRIFYLYQQREDQSQLPLFDTAELGFSFDQLFRTNRFSGIDRIGDANQVSVAITSRFLRTDTGRERFRASIGQIFYLTDRSVTLRGGPAERHTQSTSPFAAGLSVAVGNYWSLRSGALWSAEHNRLDEGSVSVHFQGDHHRDGDGQRLFNAGYRLRQDALPIARSTDMSFYWPLAARFSALASWSYDLELDRTIEAFGGLEYNDCCWQVRVIGRTFLRNPTTALAEEPRVHRGVQIQIVFRGLAGIGGRIESIMEGGIRGYRAGDVHGRF